MNLTDEFYATDLVEASCGCIYCDLKLKPVKLRRRWVHHFPALGQNIACTAKGLKPAA
jgi:hypothetical protein